METTATKRKATSAPKKDSAAAAQPVSKKAPSQKQAAASSTLRLTQVRSFFGILPNQQACLIGLGLRKIHSTSVVQDTPAVRGMITKVRHLIRVEDSSVCN